MDQGYYREDGRNSWKSFLRKMFSFQDIHKMVFHSLIYRHINYCCVLWGSVAQRDLKRVQIKFNKTRMLLECGLDSMRWSTVVEYLRTHLIKLISKILKF